jgi:orotidine-5'-phosphate decarboxylase
VSEVILALDLPSREDALALLDSVPEAKWVKVGSVLMARSGPDFVEELVGMGHHVFLDLKWHDIPNTVADAVAAAADLGVVLATVHTLGGRAMMEAAGRAAPRGLSLVGVTVLTSHTPDSYAVTVGRDEVALSEEVRRLAVLAGASGLSGVVCSPGEIEVVKPALDDGAIIVVPGIRRPGDATGDQARVATPGAAAAAGATHIVVGRPVLRSADPRTAFREILEEAR